MEVKSRDRNGNVRTVELLLDGSEYVGAIRGGAPVKMVSGNLLRPVVATGSGLSIDAAVMATMAEFEGRSR